MYALQRAYIINRYISQYNCRRGTLIATDTIRRTPGRRAVFRQQSFSHVLASTHIIIFYSTHDHRMCVKKKPRYDTVVVIIVSVRYNAYDYREAVKTFTSYTGADQIKPTHKKKIFRFKNYDSI